jgi:uncharacterized protein
MTVRLPVMKKMDDAAREGRLALQRCTSCGTVQYPPRELCVRCLDDTLAWETMDAAPGKMLAAVMLHHSHEPAMRPHMPKWIGLVRLAEAAVAVCFVHPDCEPGTDVRITAGLDEQGRAVLTASPEQEAEHG